MKKLWFATLFASFFCANAQENIVKAGVSFSNIGIMYERSVSNHFSVAAQLGLGLVSVSRGETVEVATGTGFLAEGRYYFSDKKGKMRGWHIGPAFELISGRVKEKNNYREEKFNLTAYTVNGGRQWIFTNKFTLGFHAGVGYQQLADGTETDTPLAIQLGASAGYSF